MICCFIEINIASFGSTKFFQRRVYNSRDPGIVSLQDCSYFYLVWQVFII